MKSHIHKTQAVKTETMNMSNLFVEVNSAGWKSPGKLSLEELSKRFKPKEQDVSDKIDHKTLVIDPKTLKVKVNDHFLVAPSVHHEFLRKDEVPIKEPKKSDQGIPELHLVSDSNYLYVWVGDRWKRVILSEF